MNRLPFLFVVLLAFSCRQNQVPAPSAVGAIPSEAQLRWHEMEMNAFIHFTINTFTDKEWGYGDESPQLFNPAALDVDQWIITLKDAGFKGVILTTKHHDGFCLWPSKFTGHSIEKSPYKEGKGDIVKEVSEACKRHGLKFGIYLSPWDRNRADYGTPAYVEYYRNQLKELFDNYGPVFEMWFDGANGGDGYYGGARETRRIDGATYYDWPRTLKLVKDISPDILFFSDAGPHIRWVGNERGVAGTTNWNTITPDTLYAGKPGLENLLQEGSENGTRWIPAEVDVSIRPGWFYHQKEDSLVKTPEKLFEIYLSSVGRGSTLLLNVPPDKRGLIHEKDLAALKAWKLMVDAAFKTNFALTASAVEATAVRGNDARYGAGNTTDANPSTYWATDDNIVTGSIEITLREPRTIQYVVLQEYIRLGQRVRAFTVEAMTGGGWKTIAEGTTIGYKRILKTTPQQTARIRVNIVDAKACPLISSIGIH
ncbi:MAG TPA: alpha-L-fucosidase [Chryseosolibacter sp.]|nr:alpha-L-fucosidase [Chryseosolibacter sp.]